MGKKHQAMNNEIKAIIFDMGGVIIFTCDDIPRQTLAQQLGVPVAQLKDEVFNSQSALMSEIGILSKEEHWVKVLKNLGINTSQNIKEIDEAFWAGDCIDDKLLGYIKLLKKKYKVGFLSNAFKGVREWIENHYRFLDSFDQVIFSNEVGLRKPDPVIYRMMCDKLNVIPQQAVFIDDMLVNVEGAQKVGLQAVHYQGRERLIKDLKSILRS